LPTESKKQFYPHGFDQQILNIFAQATASLLDTIKPIANRKVQRVHQSEMKKISRIGKSYTADIEPLAHASISQSESVLWSGHMHDLISVSHFKERVVTTKSGGFMASEAD